MDMFFAVIIVGIAIISIYVIGLLCIGVVGLIKLIAKAIAKRKEEEHLKKEPKTPPQTVTDDRELPQAFLDLLDEPGEYTVQSFSFSSTPKTTYVNSSEDDAMEQALLKGLCNHLQDNIHIDTQLLDRYQLKFKGHLVPGEERCLNYNYELNNKGTDQWKPADGGFEIHLNVYDRDDNLLLVQEDYVNDDGLSVGRHSEYFALSYNAIADADHIEVYAVRQE